MRYLKNKKGTLLHCSHCRKNFSARSRRAQHSARHTAGSVQLEQRAVHGGVRIVPELISFDDLRDKFLPPGSRSRATHYGNWVGISKARGLAPSCCSPRFGWMLMIQKIKKEDDSDDKILDNHDAGDNFSARTRKVVVKLAWVEFSQRHVSHRCEKTVFLSTFRPLASRPDWLSVNKHLVKICPVVGCLRIVIIQILTILVIG